jgi:hypothetical protein
MTPALKKLAERREALVRRSGVERELVANAAGAAARKLVLIDVASAFLQRIGWRPVIVAAGLLVSFVAGPRKALGWAARASALYSGFRRARRLLAALF